MTAAEQKEMCTSYKTLGPELVTMMFLSGISPAATGYQYKDILGGAFITVLAKRWS